MYLSHPMDILLFFWILFAGVVPPALLGTVLLYFQNKMAEKQLQKSIDVLRDYAKGELIGDIGDALSHRMNSMFGGISKQGSIEGQEATIQYAKENPGMAQMLMNVAGRSGARWLARKFGVPKDMADSLAGLQASLPFKLPTQQEQPVNNQPIVTQGSLYR